MKNGGGGKLAYSLAFTLAEVLITLGIIGIVAAMTMPTLIHKNEERVTITKVKKFYSVMNQALLMAIKDNGYVDEWNLNAELDENGDMQDSLLANYLKPYLKISKDCASENNCIASVNYKLLDGSDWGNYGVSKRYYKMILADGSYLWTRDSGSGKCNISDGGYPNTCGIIWFDVNGKKPPNAVGKDTFVFLVLKNSIVPSRGDNCKLNSTGWGCAAYILQHGDMKYLNK